MNHDLLAVVDELFRHRLQVPELDPDAPLVDYGLDSVRSISLIVELETEFAIHISDEQAASMRTLRDVADQVALALSVSVSREGDAA
ncbi:acyl carrier protein [Streptomyces sp. NPDC050548]|uniref:acyl carrier protein n=1 Tax=Streptomyces sp. NPDC050548 TaxID=3365629 RepID=UPI0037A4DB58